MNDLALAALAVGFAQVVKGTTGFGSALVTMPVLVMLYGPRDAIPVMVGIDTFSGLALLPSVRKQIAWPLVFAVIVPLWMGQTLGTTLLGAIPERPVAMGLGVLVALLGAGLIYRPVPTGWGELDGLPEDRGGLFGFGAMAGFVGGTLQALVGAGGPPIVAWMRRHFTDSFGRAHLIAVFAIGAVALWTQLTIRNGGFGESIPRILVCLPTLVLGSTLGRYLAGRLPRDAFGRIVGVLLLAAGLLLLGA